MTVYDPSDPRWVTNPGPLFDEIRSTNPTHRAPAGYWVVSRHEDCLSILRSRTSSSDGMKTAPGAMPDSIRGAKRGDQYAEIRRTGNDTRPFLFRDPPDHTRLRSLVQRAFTPRRVAELTPFIEEKTRQILARHVDGDAFDAVQELAWAIPVAVICEMLAIPEQDHERFQSESAQLARGLDPDFLLSDEDMAARDKAILHFGLYFHELFAQRRAQPGDDLLSALIAARDGDDQLSEGELLSTAILLLVAGHETTMNLISGLLLHLARDSDLQSRLRSEPQHDRTAVDEFLRLVAPVQLTGRTVLDDHVIGDVTIPAGHFVFVLVGAANRDPEVFEHPTSIMIDRTDNPHLGFGFGLHHCLGAPLARLEAGVVMREVLNATSRIELASDDIRYRPNVILRGLDRLDLTLHS